MENYKDVKISTLIRKLEEYLKEQNLVGLSSAEYNEKIKKVVDSFLKENGYPLHCSIGEVREVNFLMENGEKVTEIRTRYDFTRKVPIRDRKYSFKSLVKTGPCFGRKLSDTIGRRVYGISFNLDEIAYEAGKLGYTSFEEMVKAYEEAEKVVKNVQYLKMSYEFVPEEEKKKYFP